MRKTFHLLYILYSIDFYTNIHFQTKSGALRIIQGERRVGEKSEKSIIDYIIICDKMKRFLTAMTIDDRRDYVLSRYMKTKTGTKTITSDHNILIGKFSVTFERRQRQVRKEFFQFKCPESKKKFFEETSKSNQLSSCFTNPEDFKENANRFFKL